MSHAQLNDLVALELFADTDLLESAQTSPPNNDKGVNSRSMSEMREQIMEILGLEKDLQGQIVLKDIEDVQSNWEYVVEAILSYMLTSSNKKPGEDISKPGDASNIVAALEEIKKVGLEFDKNFSGTVAYNCLLNRIADLQPEASESQPVNNQADALLLQLERVVDSYSVHQPKGYAKGTVARRGMKKKIRKAVINFTKPDYASQPTPLLEAPSKRKDSDSNITTH